MSSIALVENVLFVMDPVGVVPDDDAPIVSVEVALVDRDEAPFDANGRRAALRGVEVFEVVPGAGARRRHENAGARQRLADHGA